MAGLRRMDVSEMPDQQQTALRIMGSFVRWWLGELGGLMPKALVSTFGARRACLILIVQDSDFVLLTETKNSGRFELGRLNKTSVNQLVSNTTEHPEALSALTERRYRNWPLIVELAQHLGMRKVVDLPLVNKDDLGQLLQFELDRLTPFKAEDVRLAWRVEHTDAAAKRMRVMLEIAPRTVIEQAMGLINLYQRQICRIELSGGSSDHHPLDLQIERKDREEPKDRLNVAFRLLAPLLLLIAAFIPIRQQHKVINNLESQIEATQEQAEEALKLRDQLTLMMNETSFLADAQQRYPAMTELLAELTRILPSHSHILQLNIDGSSIELFGLAGKASDLITALDRSPMMQAPKFNSAVTREAQSGKERFHILVELPARGH